MADTVKGDVYNPPPIRYDYTPASNTGVNLMVSLLEKMMTPEEAYDMFPYGRERYPSGESIMDRIEWMNELDMPRGFKRDVFNEHIKPYWIEGSTTRMLHNMKPTIIGGG